ncbi:hypothetical protein [Pseudoxanthomonas koreensis]|uniref:hypothetical protein n=1 Tax=Pseudoxanthomonas koreensis TaxID=266061 RepID=UPI0013918D0D|nr:hypothetical protein [Pseudoxanthomonas koreensis]KAF1689355.1 hypothetical protein CSC64_12870 [Pseudoxanthomonas koreensis]
MLFDLLGALLALYLAYALAPGEVVARSGPGARRYVRAESPRGYWGVIAIYAALAVALVTVF